MHWIRAVCSKFNTQNLDSAPTSVLDGVFSVRTLRQTILMAVGQQQGNGRFNVDKTSGDVTSDRERFWELAVFD